MSLLPALPPPDQYCGEAGEEAKKAKTVKTQGKNNIMNNALGLPVLPAPDGMLSTGSSAKVERVKQVKEAMKVLPAPDGMLSTGSSAKVERVKQVKKAKNVKG